MQNASDQTALLQYTLLSKVLSLKLIGLKYHGTNVIVIDLWHKLLQIFGALGLRHCQITIINDRLVQSHRRQVNTLPDRIMYVGTAAN